MRAIVVGGGVAGSVSALALRRIGAEVSVYEAYDDPAGRVGSFLSLAVNGLRGLAAAGCLEPVRAAGFEVERQRMWSGAGKRLGDVPRGRRSGDPMRGIALLRGDLVATLRAEAVAAGARIVTGERLVDAAVTEGGVRAEFASGRTAEADLLVGADGIWSATRRILDPDAPSPEYAGLYSVWGVSEEVDVPSAASVRGGEAGPAGRSAFNMVFARRGAFAHLRTPDGAVWWAAQVASPERPRLDGLDDAGLLDRLGEIYRDDAAPRSILRAAVRLDRPTLMHRLAEVPVRHDGRIVLVGDAAHPVGSGQGASMAIEDAIALARSLAAGRPVPDAVARYDAERRPRIAKIRKADGGNQDSKIAGPVARRLRDVLMPIMVPVFYERATAWLYDHDPGTLPERRETAAA